MFSTWRYNVARAARELLEGAGREGAPHRQRSRRPIRISTGKHPALLPRIRFNARVTAIGRKDFDKVRTKGRDEQPFEIRLESGETVEARAVIDASGTWNRPNQAASGGVAVPGERAHSAHIAHGIPDVLGRERNKYAGTRVLVVGSGHSAFNVVLDLLILPDHVPGTDIVWVMRRDSLDTVWGGGASDALEARGELGQRAKRAVESGRMRVLTPYRIRSIAKSARTTPLTMPSAADK